MLLASSYVCVSLKPCILMQQFISYFAASKAFKDTFKDIEDGLSSGKHNFDSYKSQAALYNLIR